MNPVGPRLAVLSGTLFAVAAVVFVAAAFAGRHYLPSLGGRTWERSPSYTSERLSAWVTAQPAEAQAYVVPLLFPLDLLFLATFAAAVSLFSVAAAGQLPALLPYAWVLVLVPVGYGCVDLFEDVLLAWLIQSRPDQIPRVIGVVQTATRLKLGLLVLSIVQVIGLALGVAARKLSH